MQDSTSTRHGKHKLGQRELIQNRPCSLSLIALSALICFSILSACSSKPPPPPAPPPPPPENPLPPVPKAEDIQNIDPNQDPSILPEPASES